MADQNELSTEEFIDQFRELSKKELDAYDKIYPRNLRQDFDLGRMFFFAGGILVGGFLMGACWLMTSLG